MYLVKTPIFIQKIFESCTWRIESDHNIYLTFDDGPDPAITPFVLETLRSFNAKATFFCIGENAKVYPKLVEQIRDEGHAIGNHSYSHISGWSTNTKNYLNDVEKCNELIKSKLYRPPFGRLKPTQLKALKQDYEIIMWDVMAGDFESQLSPDKCLNNITQNATAGSIILLHDNLKSVDKIKFVLPKVLMHFESEGLKFESITIDN